jgi:SAM-dependent methyltransferase
VTGSVLKWFAEGIRWRYQHLIRRMDLSPSKSALRANPYALDGQRYDAARYWSDRHNKYRGGFRGVGNVGLSEEENIQDYLRAAGAMADLLGAVRCNPLRKSMLDIGCGNGFWTGVFREWGVATYTGIDITDALFDLLRRRHPTLEFVRGNFAQLPWSREFDLITMIDVTQHVTDDAELERMLICARSILGKDGVFIVTSWNQARPQENFYETFRLFDFYTRALDGMAHTQPMRFRDKFVAAFYHHGRRPDDVCVEPLSRQSTRKIAEEILAA